ncbi:MAG: HlyD family efflux transporter periplasmic adaptor subunit, partial [Planctomycetota bacterium]
SAEFVVEAGAVLRERQEIIRLPNPEKMQIKCDVNESRVTLIEPDMPVKIRVDAIPGLELKGRVRKVNRYAEPGSWYSSSIKEYATFIEILDPPPMIRTGMTAEAQIFVEQLEDALQIPVEGLYEHGGELFSLVQRGENQFDTIKVDLNATNDTMACIGGEGIAAKDLIVLNLRDHLSLMDLPELDEADASAEMRSLAKRFQKDAAATRQVSDRRGPPGGPNRDGPSRGNWSGGPRGGDKGRGPGGAERRGGGDWKGKGGGGNWQGKGDQVSSSSGASISAKAKASS